MVVAVMVVDGHSNLDDRQAVPVGQHIMGMVRAEGNNTIHRKVCSTSQSDLEILNTQKTKTKTFSLVEFRDVKINLLSLFVLPQSKMFVLFF